MAPSRNTRFLTNSMSSLGIWAPSASSVLIDSLQLAHQLFGCERGGVDRGSVEPSWAITSSISVFSGTREVAHGRHLGRDVAVGRADDEGEQCDPLGLREAGGDAEVEQGDLSRGQDEQVSPVEVAVEDAVHHGALEEPDHAAPHDRLGVDAGRPHALDVGEVEPAEAFHHQHATRHQGGVGAGDDEVALTELGECHGDVDHVLRLEAEVELLDDRLGEELDERRQVGERGHGNPADQDAGPATP